MFGVIKSHGEQFLQDPNTKWQYASSFDKHEKFTWPIIGSVWPIFARILVTFEL